MTYDRPLRILSSILCLAMLAVTASSQRLLLTIPVTGPGELRGLGDVNGDGFGDVLRAFVGAAGSKGVVRVYSGRDARQLYEFVGDKVGDYFGEAIGAAGDVNGDGVPDIIVGVRRALVRKGLARVFSGKDGKVLHTFTGDSFGDFFGSSVGGAGDLNRDGYADLVVGAERAKVGRSLHGKVRVFSGKDGKILYTVNAALVGNTLVYNFGSRVDGVGDVNGDGHADVILGESDASSARVFSGKDGAVLYSVSGRYYGSSVIGGGDLNKDGVPDFLVGASRDGSRGTGAGVVVMVSGKDGSILQKLYGNATDRGFGSSVDFVGDNDRDGHTDFVVRASSATFVMSGKPNPPAFNRFGVGCAGSAPTPLLHAISPPLLGREMVLELARLKPAKYGFWLIGFSDQMWRGAKLPLDLAFMRMPGCRLLASWDFGIPFFTGAGVGRLKIPIPQAWALLGFPFFVQGWVQDDKANAAGIATSNGGKGVIQ